MEEKLGRIEQMLGRLEAAEGAARALLAMGTDVVDRAAAQDPAALEARLRAVVGLLDRLSRPEILSVLEEGLSHHAAVSRILRSGAFDPPALDIIHKLAGALAAAAHDPPRIGLWGAMKAAGTEPVQQALGFAVSLAARFGQSIADARPTLALHRGEE